MACRCLFRLIPCKNRPCLKNYNSALKVPDESKNCLVTIAAPHLCPRAWQIFAVMSIGSRPPVSANVTGALLQDLVQVPQGVPLGLPNSTLQNNYQRCTN